MASVVMDGDEKSNPLFHDFLGMSCGSGSGSGERVVEAEASVSIGGSSAGFGVVSRSSDFGSGWKRSNSDSAFTGLSLTSDKIRLVAPDFPEHLHLKKMARKELMGDQQNRPSDTEKIFPTKSSQKPASTSSNLHFTIENKLDAFASKWELPMSMNAGYMAHENARSQSRVFMNKVSPCSQRDSKSGAVVISQSAADEGSRTGMKGSGVLKASSSSLPVERNVEGASLSSGKTRIGSHRTEPEASIAPSHNGTSISRQMTIFYDGQAHVFDDVHPNKADVIMALAGTNGGSWSTTYGNSSLGDKDTNLGNLAFLQNSDVHNSVPANKPSQAARALAQEGSCDVLKSPRGTFMYRQ